MWSCCLCLLGMLVLVATAGAGTASGSHYIGRHLAALNGHSQPTIWFVDRTDSTWPIEAAAQEWDRTSSVTMGRRSVCPHAGDYCVPVNQVTSLPNGDKGLSVFCYSTVPPTHISRYNPCSASQPAPVVYVSNTTDMGSQRRSVACHELGHWFNLTHRQPSDSCMRNDSIFPTLPDVHDFNQISRIYDHSH